jgi:hypothetical protein
MNRNESQVPDVLDAGPVFVGDTDLPDSKKEEEYWRLINSGLSDSEARGTVWPDENE